MAQATRSDEAVVAETAGADGSRHGGRRVSRYASEWIERAQDVVSGAVAVTMVLLAATILVAAVVDFARSVHHPGLTAAAPVFVDKVLLVLILVEIVHTVVLSLRAHALVAQPFVVVGLIAVIRRILFVLSGQQKLDATSLALYIGMVAVFVGALVAIELIDARRKRRGSQVDQLTELP